MFYYEHLISLVGFTGCANYFLLATIPYAIAVTSLYKYLEFNLPSELDEFLAFCLMSVLVGFIVVPLLVWGLPFILTAAIGAAIYFIIELFITGKYTITRKEK